MKTHWKAILLVAALFSLPAFAQINAPANDPEEIRVRMNFAELQYLDLSGETVAVPARNLLLVRILDPMLDPDLGRAAAGMGRETVQIELYYENGDYSLVHTRGFHLIRKGAAQADVNVARSAPGRMIFPNVR